MLATVVCQDPETRATNPVDINIHIVLEACRGLAMVDQSGVCRFSHLSVQEYLEILHYSKGQTHLVAGTVCLQLLLDPTNWQILESSQSGSGDWVDDLWDRGSVEDGTLDNRILWYAVAYWPDHVRLHAEECIDDCIQTLLKEFLGSPKEGGPAYMCWSHAFLRDFNKALETRLSRSPGPAFVVGFFSLNQILSNWWISNIDVDSLDDDGRSLLHIAGLKSNLTAAAELLDLGGNPNIEDKLGSKALYAAAYGGNKALVRLLLDRGVDVNAEGGAYSYALQAATSESNEAVVRLLLD